MQKEWSKIFVPHTVKAKAAKIFRQTRQLIPSCLAKQ